MRGLLIAGLVFLNFFALPGCGGSSSSTSGISGSGTSASVAAPTFTTKPAQNGAVVLSMTTSTAGAVVHYTVDGTSPTASSPVYQTPVLISSNLNVKAIAISAGENSSVASWSLPGTIPAGTLVWSEEFSNSTNTKAQPDPGLWTYDKGNDGFGNAELEDYCVWGSTSAPCDPLNPNAYVGTDGYLHIAARQPSPGVYTSARLKSQGLFSVLYGRIEARMRVPEAQGFWPAFWTLGNNISSDNWPACGELDIEERVNAATNPDWNAGSVHGTGFVGTNLSTKYNFPATQTAAGWHTYGMIWSPGKIAYYIDDPANVYATYTAQAVNAMHGAVWPFDSGNGQFIILNMAVGGDWPGSPNSTTPFPSEVLVDYIRVYAN